MGLAQKVIQKYRPGVGANFWPPAQRAGCGGLGVGVGMLKLGMGIGVWVLGCGGWGVRNGVWGLGGRELWVRGWKLGVGG